MANNSTDLTVGEKAIISVLKCCIADWTNDPDGYDSDYYMNLLKALDSKDGIKGLAIFVLKAGEEYPFTLHETFPFTQAVVKAAWKEIDWQKVGQILEPSIKRFRKIADRVIAEG